MGVNLRTTDLTEEVLEAEYNALSESLEVAVDDPSFKAASKTTKKIKLSTFINPIKLLITNLTNSLSNTETKAETNRTNALTLTSALGGIINTYKILGREFTDLVAGNNGTTINISGITSTNYHVSATMVGLSGIQGDVNPFLISNKTSSSFTFTLRPSEAISSVTFDFLIQEFSA